MKFGLMDVSVTMKSVMDRFGCCPNMGSVPKNASSYQLIASS
ncbi:MAG: hypothetical protein KGV48_001945 [Alcaligenaceae bacterium]|nr:hypothetical protein [Alcaligenaceae bacterium]